VTTHECETMLISTCHRELARLPQPSTHQDNIESANLQPNIATMLPDEIIVQLNAEFQCRDEQIQHLAALYSVRMPHRPNMHKTNNTGASPLSTLSQHTRLDCDRQIFDPAILFPFLAHTAHDYQCARMHHHATPSRAHCRS
jgi:hypothetical protein